MFDARYVQKGEAIDYTPVADTAAGTVVFIGKLCGVTKLDIKAGALGALGVTGVFEFKKATGSAIDAGAAVYWDGSKAVTTPNSKYLGIVVAGAASADTSVRALINVGESGYAGDDSSSSSSN